MASSYYPSNSSSSIPNPLFSSVYSQLPRSLEIPTPTDDPIVVKTTTSGIRAVDSAAATMKNLTEIEELSLKIDKLVNLIEIEELSLRVDTLVLALDEISKELGECQSKPSPGLLARWKRFLTTKAKTLLLLEHKIYVSESIDEDWKSNSFESFELVGSVMKKVKLIVKVIDEKLEAATVDSSSASNFTQQSSNPLVPDASDGILGSFPATNSSHKLGESQMTEDEIFFKSKSISLGSGALSSVRTLFPNSSTPDLADTGNFRSTPIIDFSCVDGSSVVKEVSKYNGNSTFLAYQEGKPFNYSNEPCIDAVGFQVERVIDSEVKNLNAFNQNYNANLQQFVDRKLNRGPNLNAFLTSNLNSFTSTNFVTNFNSSVKFVPVFSYTSDVIKDLLGQPTTRSTSLCDTISGFNCIHKLFDRGKFENMFWSSLLKSSDVDCSNFCQHHNYTGVIYFWLIHMCAIRGKCSYCVLIFAGRVIDRGKWLELIRLYSHYNSSNFHFSFNVLKLGLLVLNSFILKHSFSANFNSEMNSELEYNLDLSSEYSDMFLFAKNNDSCDTRKVIEEMVPQIIILGTRMRLQMTSQSGFGCSDEVFDPCLGRDSSFSTQMEGVRRDFVTAILNSILKLQSSSTKTTTETFYSRMGNLSSAGCILVFSGRVVDSGRFLDSNNSNFCLNNLTPGKSVLMGSTGISECNGKIVYEQLHKLKVFTVSNNKVSSVKCVGYSLGFARMLFDRGKAIDKLKSGYSVYELTVELGFCFEFLFKYSNGFVFGNNGDSQVGYKFFEEMLQHVSGTMSTTEVFENSHELIDQMFSNCKKNFSCNKGNLNLLLRYGLFIQGMLNLVTAQHLSWWWRDKLHYSRAARYDEFSNAQQMLNPNFWLSSTHEGRLGQFLKQVNHSAVVRYSQVIFSRQEEFSVLEVGVSLGIQLYQPAVEWYSQVNTLYTLEAGVRRLHVYTVIMLLLSAESYCDLLKLKRGYRRVQPQERGVEMKRGRTTIIWVILDGLIREDKVYKLCSQMGIEVVGVESCSTVGKYLIAKASVVISYYSANQLLFTQLIVEVQLTAFLLH